MLENGKEIPKHLDLVKKVQFQTIPLFKFASRAKINVFYVFFKRSKGAYKSEEKNSKNFYLSLFYCTIFQFLALSEIAQ